MKNITYKVPGNNKEIFIDQAIDHIPEIVKANIYKIRDYRFEINGVLFQILRDKTREELLRKAVYYTNGIKSLLRKDKFGLCVCTRNSIQEEQSWQRTQEKLYIKGQALDYESIKNFPITQIGHEPIFYHTGIWIKNHLAQYLVQKGGGIGVNMIVDNDACNTGFMYVPVLTEKPASVQKVALVKGKEHVAYEEIMFDDFGTILRFKEEVMTLLDKNKLDKNLKTTIEYMQSTFEVFINRIMECYHQGCTDMVGLLTSARRALEEDFGIDNLEIPVSLMCDTDGFYHFLLHILYKAEQFVKIYNEKLAEYRMIHKICSKANPLPDLKISGNLVELPFWIWKSGEQRGKCYLLNDDEESIKITNGVNVLVTLKKGEEAVKNISRLKTLSESHIKIRPRAITTTMFSRLFFSDVFIHGIGGAKYDSITDEIIKEFFGIESPSFITISANLFLPFETFDLDARTLQDHQYVLRDMCYNPERYASKEIQNDTEFINQVKEKERLLKTIAVSNREVKKLYFNRIKELNKSILTKLDDELRRKQQEINAINDKLAYNKLVRFREYPVFIYPMNVLREYFLNLFSEG